MPDISGFGSQLTIFASETFPAGLTITEFADDADPFDTPSIQIRDKAMGLNGTLVTWGKAQPVSLAINVIPGGQDDTNLTLLFDLNRVVAGKRMVRDVINGALLYPDGSTSIFNNGVPTDYVPTISVASSARMKSRPFTFAFQSKL